MYFIRRVFAALDFDYKDVAEIIVNLQKKIELQSVYHQARDLLAVLMWL